MKLYTMALSTPKDHRRHSTWVFESYWYITKLSQLNILIRRLSSKTKYDSIGRVLCLGFPAKNMALQQRIYIVKLGHDGKLWSELSPLGEQLQHELSIVGTP
jgi:hypothetical protein